MSGILEDACKDLYDQILQNPDYLTSQSNLVESFLAKLTKQTAIRCHYCIKQIKQFQLISQGKHLYCITCFSHIILENKQPYLVINLSKKGESQSSLNLAQQLKTINTIKQYGIEHQRVRNVDLTDLSLFKKNLKGKEQIQEVEDKIFKDVQPKKGQILFSQYSINDYMLAYMHEKTNQKLRNFILQRKSLEEKEKQEVIRDVDKICKSQNDQAEIDQESELSIDYERINTDTKEILKKGKDLLKKIGVNIKKNKESKQKKMSRLRRFRANKIIRETKVDLGKKSAANIQHQFSKKSINK